jgi:cytoskeletal protein RodZ
MMSIKHVLASVALGVALIAAPATIDASTTTPPSKMHASKTHPTKSNSKKKRSKNSKKHSSKKKSSKSRSKTSGSSHKGTKPKTMTSNSGWKHHPGV